MTPINAKETKLTARAPPPASSPTSKVLQARSVRVCAHLACLPSPAPVLAAHQHVHTSWTPCLRTSCGDRHSFLLCCFRCHRSTAWCCMLPFKRPPALADAVQGPARPRHPAGHVLMWVLGAWPEDGAAARGGTPTRA